MEKRCVVSPNSPPVAGPYSAAVVAGDFLFVSGQIAMAKDGSGVIKGTIEEEARRTLENLKTLLEDAGSSMEQVVKTTVFLADMEDFARFNAVYAEYFPQNPPTRSCIQAGRLPLDLQVEIEAIALLS